MSWDKVERRSTGGFCNQHIQVIADSAVIKNSVQNIEKMMASKDAFKAGVILVLVAQGVLLITNLVLFSYFYGIQVRQIEINTKRLDIIEQVARDFISKNEHTPPTAIE